MFEKILARLAKVFHRQNIPYMIIGGQGVLIYGEPRVTRDIDITIGMGLEGLDKILFLLKELGLRVAVNSKDVESFVKKTMVLPAIDLKTSIRVDFIFSYTSYERQAIRRVKKVKIMNQYVHYASVEDLIIHKILAGRPRDLEDLSAIFLKNPSTDKRYVRKWLKEFDKTFEQKKLIHRFELFLKALK